MKRYIFLLLLFASCSDKTETIVCECTETKEIIVYEGKITDIDICDKLCK